MWGKNQSSNEVYQYKLSRDLGTELKADSVSSKVDAYTYIYYSDSCGNPTNRRRYEES